MRGKRILLFFLMIGLGLGAGLLYGWVINPVKYADTSLNALSPDYKADYVLMVAQIYQSDKNLEQAARRLAVLDHQPPASIVTSALLTARSLNYASSDLEEMDRLAKALQTAPNAPTGAPNVGGQP